MHVCVYMRVFIGICVCVSYPTALLHSQGQNEGSRIICASSVPQVCLPLKHVIVLS